MADIRILQGKAWLGTSTFGVKLNIYGQAPNSSPVLLGYTPEDSPGNGTLGNGEFQGIPWYLLTNGIGTYKLWAEHPNHAGTKSNEVTYYFDPDNYQGSGDPFDWNGDGIVQSDLVVPGKWFSIQGVHKRILDRASDGTPDWDHIVASTSSNCSELLSNRQHFVTVPTGETEGQAPFSGLKFAFTPNVTSTTFYVYIRDHNCTNQSNVYTITGVTSSGGNYDVGTLTLDFNT